MSRCFALVVAFAGGLVQGSADRIGAAEPSPAASHPAPAKAVLSEQLIREIEPDLDGRPERLAQYLQRFQRLVIRDPRLFAFQAQAEWRDGNRVRLTGFVEFAEHRAALLEVLRTLGFAHVEDHLESLPSAQLGAKKYGLVKVTHSLGFDRPAGERSVENDCLLGEPLYLLREGEAGYFLCHSGEGYLCYVDGRDIHRVDEAEFVQYQSGPQVQVCEDHIAGKLRLPAGARLKRKVTDSAFSPPGSPRWFNGFCTTPDNHAVPGAAVPPSSAPAPQPNHGGPSVAIQLLMPTGETATIPAAKCEVFDDACAPPVERAIAAAQRLQGTPYRWGGRTSAGIDCSGLVQTAFATAGLHLPRDSDQQAYLGRLTATRWSRAGLRRGDTLYFLRSDGRIGHTAIYLGDGRCLEAVRPVVRITSFHASDPDYSAARDASFAFGKRLAD